jgi:hypothetical protein
VFLRCADKHGQLGIWDARALPDEADDDDDDDDADDTKASAGEKEGGKYWRLQTHWPATSKSVRHSTLGNGSFLISDVFPVYILHQI